ncbi:MAG TPA: alanine--glyoxylate aminotransferase family protein [Thermoanaerobaculia bacterium]|nr:alanine--glyoxylate aminotransferase family protein [Thermoanaerobaculia bacterium]
MTDLSTFFVPGPTWVRPEILAEMTRPMIGHRSAEFRELCGRVFDDLRKLFLTSGNVFVAASSGTGLLEGALLNCVPRRVLVTTCGAFSERWREIAQQLGVEVDILEHEWGKPVDAERLATHFTGRRYHYDAVTFTHNETSTGVLNDLEALTAVVHAESHDTLILVDAVSSLACTPIAFDDWKIDVCIASTQKGLALPPGLTLFAVSERALEAARKKAYRGTYFDFLLFDKHAREGNVPFTPSVSHFYALAAQLEHILRVESIETRWARHLQLRDMTIERTAAFCQLMADESHASPSITALAPRKLEPSVLLARMKERGYTLASGYGRWKPAGIRIGHMGDISLESLSAMLDVLAEVADA